jgi:hypothetical protein
MSYWVSICPLRNLKSLLSDIVTIVVCELVMFIFLIIYPGRAILCTFHIVDLNLNAFFSFNRSFKEEKEEI